MSLFRSCCLSDRSELCVNKLILVVWEVSIGTAAKEERGEKVAEVLARDHVTWTKLVTSQEEEEWMHSKHI